MDAIILLQREISRTSEELGGLEMCRKNLKIQVENSKNLVSEQENIRRSCEQQQLLLLEANGQLKRKLEELSQVGSKFSSEQQVIEKQLVEVVGFFTEYSCGFVKTSNDALQSYCKKANAAAKKELIRQETLKIWDKVQMDRKNLLNSSRELEKIEIEEMNMLKAQIENDEEALRIVLASIEAFQNLKREKEFKPAVPTIHLDSISSQDKPCVNTNSCSNTYNQHTLMKLLNDDDDDTSCITVTHQSVTTRVVKEEMVLNDSIPWYRQLKRKANPNSWNPSDDTLTFPYN